MLALVRPLVVSGTTKVVLLSLDGLGGLPRPETGRSELETARLPHLSALAHEAACGLLRHVAPGITPGSGPGHLGLFGYDPIEFQVGRGVLESLGIEFDLRPGDVAARGNFCTVDAEGRITDLIASGAFFEDLGRDAFNPAWDRIMICGGPEMLADCRRIAEEAGFDEGSSSKPGTYVIEKAFVEK